MLRRLLIVLVPALLLLTACAGPPSVSSKSMTEAQKIASLADAIMDLGPGVDPAEAARAARIAYEHTAELAIAYQITDPPLIHNIKVNKGLRPRGLCWHWATDMEARLKEENFRTLQMHRAIANADDPIRIDHSTAIISRRGDAMSQGIVLDPWRHGGVLFWAPVLEDTRYVWVPRNVVLERRRARMAARRQGMMAPAPAPG